MRGSSLMLSTVTPETVSGAARVSAPSSFRFPVAARSPRARKPPTRHSGNRSRTERSISIRMSIMPRRLSDQDFLLNHLRDGGTGSQGTGAPGRLRLLQHVHALAQGLAVARGIDPRQPAVRPLELMVRDAGEEVVQQVIPVVVRVEQQVMNEADVADRGVEDRVLPLVLVLGR